MAAIARVPEEMMLNVPCELQKYRLLQIECSQMFSTMYRKTQDVRIPTQQSKNC